MTDADLSNPVRRLAGEVLATDQAERLLALAWNLRALIAVGALARASVPEEEIDPAELPGSPLIRSHASKANAAGSMLCTGQPSSSDVWTIVRGFPSRSASAIIRRRVGFAAPPPVRTTLRGAAGRCRR